MDNFVENISKQFVRKIDTGVTIDLKDYFEDDELVKDYELKTTEDNKYIATVKLTEFDRFKVKDIFYPLMRFANYKTTFYTHEEYEDSITYYLLSMNSESDLGFYLSITFSQG